MDLLSKMGFALIIFGGLIFAGMIIWVFVKILIEAIPWYVQLAITAIILGIILMFLSALYDRYRTVKTEEVHEKV
jgi:membrane protein implicated in regulation of membrane protease activity